ncbi:MAG: alpha-amylase family glycosyl hydrolase [Actinomycetota bacterium]
MAEPWWKAAVVYQIYPRSFRDSPGRPRPTGAGDLEGIRRGLDHLAWVGVDAVWLSPFFPSPMRDFGYDVADYCDVDPGFGSLADFDRLVHDAHARGIRVLVDWVPNHSSDQHPWFVESRRARTSPKRDWYIWRDGEPSAPPNNWVAAFTDGPAWTWDAATRQWYLHQFLPEQPDLNWDNPEVVAAMHDVLRFWLDRGVDGFRIDVVHGIGKDPALPDDPPEVAGRPHSSLNDTAATHGHIRAIRRLVDSYPGDRVLVGEVYLLDTSKVAAYYGDGDELHLAFNFPPLYAPWEAAEWRRQIERAEAEFAPHDGWPSWVLSNHDNPRHRTRYGSAARAAAAAVLLLTLRGTPFLYAGEELGLEDAVVPPERRVDPGGRDGCRAPVPWEPGPSHGWATERPWLPWPPDPDCRNAEVLRADAGSILHLYRRLLAARARSPALRLGDVTVVDAPPGVLAYERAVGGDRRLVVVHFEDGPAPFDPGPGWTVDVAADGAGEGGPFGGVLPGPGAVVLRREAVRRPGPAHGTGRLLGPGGAGR